MKKKFLILFALIFGAFTYAVGQYVSNVRYHITDSAVIIVYDLNVTADVSIYVSTDNGKTFSKELYFVEGDVGTNVSPGKNKKIVWPISSKYLSDKLQFNVDAKPINKANHPAKSQGHKKSNPLFPCIIGGINCDFSPRFKWEGIGGWIGYMKRVGFYFNFLTNWWPNRSNTPIIESYIPCENSSSIEKIRRSYDIGLLIRTCEPLSIKIGCGYGKYKEFMLMKDPNNHYAIPNWYYDPKTSIQGFEFNFGLLFHIDWFNLSLETTAINFKHYDIRLGLGFSIDI